MLIRRLQRSSSGGSAAVVVEPPQTGEPLTIDQYGVSLQFDQDYPHGQFANGDWWVCPTTPGGTVRLNRITPDYIGATTRHGWMINPSSMSEQSLDGRRSGWNPSLMPSLPADISGGSSVVKAVSYADPGGTSPDHIPSLETAVVLTVLNTPPSQPAQTFRPPYYGSYKPLYTIADIDQSKLPSLAPVGSPPTLNWVRDRFQRLQLDNYHQFQSRYIHPADNFRATPGSGDISNYGASLARDNNSAILRLMLNDSWAQKQAALVNVLQAGLDWFGTVNAGGGWTVNGGHSAGRKIMIFFAAMMFDSNEIKQVMASPAENVFPENDYISWSPSAQQYLWGAPGSASAYWSAVETGNGNRQIADPTSQIDGGYSPGAGYQNITTSNFSEAALIVRLMDGIDVWAHDGFLSYVDRWRNHGTWTQPDTETARRPDFWNRHGTRSAENYRNSFQEAMWNAYR